MSDCNSVHSGPAETSYGHLSDGAASIIGRDKIMLVRSTVVVIIDSLVTASLGGLTSDGYYKGESTGLGIASRYVCNSSVVGDTDHEGPTETIIVVLFLAGYRNITGIVPLTNVSVEVSGTLSFGRVSTLVFHCECG